MSVHEDALRDLAANHGWGFCDAVADEINDLEASYASLFKTHGELQSDLASAQEELERERMRLVACGVVAMANTPESAADARQIHEDYRSASLSDVERAVNAEMKLRTELAAAQEELVRERMAQTNVEMAHAQEKNELRQQLAAAQEDRDSARDRVKSLVLDLSAAVGRYQRAEERVRELENFADLMADEFQRIVVCCESGDTFVASEIIGLCQRAVKTTKQNVPVIVQRDRAEALAESYKAEKEAAVAQERERCAKVCERLGGLSDAYWHPSFDHCAAAIRRGE